MAEADAYDLDDGLSHLRVRVADFGTPEFGEILDVREAPAELPPPRAADGVGRHGSGARLVIGCIAGFANTVENGCRDIFIQPVPERTKPDLIAYVETRPIRTERVRALRAV